MPAPTVNTKNTSNQAGLYLLEVVIAVGILLMFTHAFFTLITTSYQILAQSRSQATARAIANERMELIRNLPYDDVGTVSGIPSGTIPQSEDVTRNGQTFTVNTAIIYHDDDFDNLAPTDTLPTDYKIARVEVTWSGSTFPTNQSITTVSNIAPRGVETTAGGGTLSILVFDAQGSPVSQAEVTIDAPAAAPPVNIVQTTDNFGNLVLPGAPECISCYNITVTKSGYSTDRTYTTAEVDNPDEPPATILAGQVTQVSFSIDTLSTITFNSTSDASTSFTPVGNVDFTITSSKTIGTDTLSNPVFKLDQVYTTDGSGQLQMDLEWDNYTLNLDNSTYNLGGSNPFSPVNIQPAQTMSVDFISLAQQAHSILAQVQNASGSAVASASAILSDGLGFDQTISTGLSGQPDFGQAFFNTGLGPFTYTLDVSHPSYQTNNFTFTINGATKQIIILNPN